MFFHCSVKCKKLVGSVLCGIILLLMFSSHLNQVLYKDSGKESLIENNPSGPSEEYFQTRYGNRVLEDFNNWTNIDKEKTDCSFRTLESRAYLWGCSPVIPPEYAGMMNLDTHSHGGGFSPKYNEYWYPEWSGTTIYQYDLNRNYLGNFNSGQREMMQLWGDLDGTYYTANWNQYHIYKWSDRGSNQIWSYRLGTNWNDRGGGICCDDEFVYAIKYNSRAILILNKTNGQFIRSYNLPQNTYCYGGLAYANDLLYVSGYGNDRQRVGIFTAENGSYQGSFQSQVGIYNMAYNGEEYCVSSNNNNVHKYKISDGNSYLGNDIEPPTNITYIQSKVLHHTWQTIGAARITWYEHKPAGTDIEYRITADGKNWERMVNNTHHVFTYPGSPLRWNATLKTDNKSISPYLDKIIIEYDLVDDPEPTGPSSDLWQGTSTPTLEWYFKDPDKFDHQSDYIVEIFGDEQMNTHVYNSTWTNSTVSKHTITQPLDDGVYYWRVRATDSYHAKGNWSELKKFMIDTTKPVGSIVIEDGAVTVKDQLANLEISATDNASGVADMQILSDRGSLGPWEEYDTRKRIAMTPTDGIKTIGVRFRDHAGIVSDIFNDTVYLDLCGPGDVEIMSSSHPDPAMYYNSTDPVFQWVPPYERTALKGYSYVADNSGHTDPARVLNVENGDMTGTAPGEFKGLSDGKWYFHIIPCDIYDQWGNTTHFRFNIDSTEPLITKLTPVDEEWYTVNEIRAEVVFEDEDGFGLKADSIMYSHKKAGGSFSEWTTDGMNYDIMLRTINENPVKIKAWVDIPLLEGDDNAIKWRISDISGNGPMESEEVIIKVDWTPLNFSDPIPDENDVSNENTVPVGITISDLGGSGVNGRTIQYCISNSGDDPESFINWTPMDYDMVDERIDVFEGIVFEPGRNNYIKWRAKDVAGNGFIESPPYRVQVNSKPVPAIYKPQKNAVYEIGESIHLNATGSYDNEDVELTYYWKIENTSTHRTYFTYSGMSTEMELEKTGKYTVYLYVDDGHGFNESKKIFIEIVPESTGGGGGTEQGGTGSEEQGMLSSWLWLILVIIIGIVGSVIAVIVIARKKEIKVDAGIQRPQLPSRPKGPYGFDTMEYHHPRYSETYDSSQALPSHQYPASPVYGWGNVGPTPGGEVSQGIEGTEAGQVGEQEQLAEAESALPESGELGLEIDIDSFKLAPLPALDFSVPASSAGSKDKVMLPSSTSIGSVEIKALPPATMDEADPGERSEDDGEKTETGEKTDTAEQPEERSSTTGIENEDNSEKEKTLDVDAEATSEGPDVGDKGRTEDVSGEAGTSVKATETTSEESTGPVIEAQTGEVPKEVKSSVEAEETASEGSLGEGIDAQAVDSTEEAEISDGATEMVTQEANIPEKEIQTEDDSEQVENPGESIDTSTPE